MARDVGYVVFKGYRPGVYESWNECEAQINGFDGSFVKSYNSLSEAYKVYALYPPRWNKERVCSPVVTKTISHESKLFPYLIGSLMGAVVAIVFFLMLR